MEQSSGKQGGMYGMFVEAATRILNDQENQKALQAQTSLQSAFTHFWGTPTSCKYNTDVFLSSQFSSSSSVLVSTNSWGHLSC